MIGVQDQDRIAMSQPERDRLAILRGVQSGDRTQGSSVIKHYRSIGLYFQAPLGEARRTNQALFDRAKCGLRQSNTAFVRCGDLADERMDLSPGHRAGPPQHILDRTQQGSVPVLFQYAPAPFDRVVFAVIRRQVDQFDLDPMTVRELHQPLHELRARTADLRTVVEFDLESLHAGMDRSAFGPPAFQTVGNEVAGLLRVAEDDPRLLNLDAPTIEFENAEGDQNRFGGHVVIDGFEGLGTTRLAAA